MTAPTSPGVVPADVRLLAERYTQAWVREGNMLEDVIEQAIMADRANRPSLTEDEREQVRREATEDERDRLFASVQCSPNAIIDGRDDHWRSVNRYWLGDQGAMLPQKRVALRRALADRSEPRQEKGGKA